MNLRLPIGILAAGAAVLVAACGGGGGGSNLPASSGNASNGGTANAGSQPASGVRVILTYNANAVAARSLHRTLRVGTAQARRSPDFVSYIAHGLQLTVSSGSASQTLYYAIGYYSPVCNNEGLEVTCTLIVPTLGSTETISAIEVDQQPANLAQNGLGTGFPSNSGVLARGSATVTVNAGGYTNVALSMNPILANWYDCGFDNSSANMNEDYSTQRIVVTSGVASSNVMQPIAADYDGYEIAPGYNNGAYAAQPFIDLNAAPVPASATSTSQHVTLFAIPALASPTPAPPYAATQTQSFPNSGYLTTNCCGGLQLAVQYDGQSTAQSTLTFANNLTATPPPFTASPSPSSPPVPASYATTRAYQVVPISVTPTTLSLQANGSASAMVTASDPGANQNMGIYQCFNGSQAQLATVTGGTLANGAETFTVTAGTTPGTCTFTVYDSYSGVVTNAVTVTLTAVP
jgi:hypothetical protein